MIYKRHLWRGLLFCKPPNNTHLLQAKIVDSDDRVMPVNTAGEICFRGYNVMLGYWDDKEKTDACIDPSGWFHSG